MFLVDGLLRAKSNSSFLDLEPLYTSYVSNATDADWRVDHIVQGARKKANVGISHPQRHSPMDHVGT